MLKQLLKMHATNEGETAEMKLSASEQSVVDSATSATITRTPMGRETLAAHFGSKKTNMLDEMKLSESIEQNVVSTQIM